MTLQSSGAISLLDLRTEFGVSGTVDFSTFYSGTEGAVPPPFNGFNDDIPTSGSGTSISLNDFYGAQNTYEVTITSVGSVTSKVSEIRGYSGQTQIYGNISNSFLPNLQAQLKSSNNSYFLGSNITLQMSAVDDAGGFGATKIGAFTTVTWFAETTTVKYRKNQLSVGGIYPDRSYSVLIGTVSEGAKFWPHVPTGGVVKIRFENNG